MMTAAALAVRRQGLPACGDVTDVSWRSAVLDESAAVSSRSRRFVSYGGESRLGGEKDDHFSVHSDSERIALLIASHGRPAGMPPDLTGYGGKYVVEYVGQK
jgi:hypothetical protein